MTCREESNQVWKHEYNEENRLSVVKKMNGADCTTQGSETHTWTFSYDGDGTRVKEVYDIGGTNQYTKHYFAGGAYEVEVNHIPDPDTSSTKRYYSIAGQMVAMHDGTNLRYFAQDHLSSTSIMMDNTGGLLSHNRYMPFGQVRDITGSDDPIDETDFGYTGQRNLGDMGLMDYKARFYSPTLGTFTQPDTIVPELDNPQSLNRYSYVYNNPLRYRDPTGHCIDGVTTILCIAAAGAIIGAVVGAASAVVPQMVKNVQQGEPLTANIDPAEVGKAAIVGAVSGTVGAAVGFAGAALVGTGLVAMVAVGAGAGVASGQASRATYNTFEGNDITEGLFDPTDMLLDAAIGGVTSAVSYGITRAVQRFKASRVRPNPNQIITADEINWDSYPDGVVPRPKGPFRVLDGDEYDAARTLANKVNRTLHKNPALKGLDIHEIHPIKFGGDPISLSNRVALDRPTHVLYNKFWDDLLRSLQ